MIHSELELAATRKRIEQFQNWLQQIRKRAADDEFDAMSSGYRLEIERMQAEVMDYLLRPTARGGERQPA